MVQSIIFCFLVSAQAFKWNSAGNVKAMGVHVSDPTIPRNLSNLSPMAKVKAIVNATTIVLEAFLDHYLFFVFGQPS